MNLKLDLIEKDKKPDQLDFIPSLTLNGVIERQREKQNTFVRPAIKSAAKFTVNHQDVLSPLKPPSSRPLQSPGSIGTLQKANAGIILPKISNNSQASTQSNNSTIIMTQSKGQSPMVKRAKAQTLISQDFNSFSFNSKQIQSSNHQIGKNLILDDKMGNFSPKPRENQKNITLSPLKVRSKAITQLNGGGMNFNSNAGNFNVPIEKSLFNQNQQYVKSKIQIQEEINEQQRSLFKDCLPVIKLIRQDISKIYEKNSQFAQYSQCYGVEKDYLIFYFVRFLELAAGSQEINPKNLEFFRISSLMFQELMKRVEFVVNSQEEFSEKDEFFNNIHKWEHIILPQSLLESLGSNEKIPKLFRIVVKNLNTFQDFYLQDYVMQQYDIQDSMILNLMKTLLNKDKEYAMSLIEKIPNKASFTFPQFYIGKHIIWQSLIQFKYDSHTVNNIMEIIEYYRFQFWKRKRNEIQNTICPIFTQQLPLNLDLHHLSKDEQRQFSHNLFTYLLIDFNLTAASKELRRAIPDLDKNILMKNLMNAVTQIWIKNKFDPYLFEDFKIKIRKCSYILKLQSRPFNTKLQETLIEESKIHVSKESQHIGGDLLNPKIVDLITFIINFLYSTKDSISTYDIVGAIEAYNLSKMVGKHIICIIQMSLKSINHDPKKSQQCIQIIQEIMETIRSLQKEDNEQI